VFEADATVGRDAAEGTRDFVSAPYRFVEVPGAGHFITDDSPGVVPPLLVEHFADPDRR
jgi:pimeloyl-ACP methyl ester carboxylesterase